MDITAQEVWRTVRALNDAWTRGDGAALADYFHPRMTAIAPNVRERIVGRAACVAAWQAFIAAAAVRSWQEIEPRVQLFGNTAVVTYEYEGEVETGGRRLTLRGRDMMTLRREEGRWWLIADQFSPLPGEAG